MANGQVHSSYQVPDSVQQLVMSDLKPGTEYTFEISSADGSIRTPTVSTSTITGPAGKHEL